MSLLDQLATDLDDVIYDTSTGFAELATASGGGTLTVIFDVPFYAADPGGAIQVGNAQPSCRMRDADAAGLSRGNVLTIRSVDYSVIEKQPNGQGENIITLRKV